VVEDVLEEYREAQPEFAEMLQAPVNKVRAPTFFEPELPGAGHRARRDGAPVENPAPGRCRLDLRHQRMGGGKLLHVPGRRRKLEKHRDEVKVKAVEDLGCKVWLNTE
jgi:hypothetical protein